MKRVSAKFVPRILTSEQKEQRLSISLELRDRVTSDPNFFQKFITGDESWVYGYDPETKVQSSQWKTPNSPRPKKARQSKASAKVMLIVFFDLRGLCGLSSYLVALQSTLHIIKVCWNVYGTMYAEKVRRSWRMVSCCSVPHFPSHPSVLVGQKKKKNTVSPHPPYSTDLAPCDFWLFPKLKLIIKGKRFASIPEIEAATTTRLKGLTKDDFQNCFKKWQERWNKFMASQGDYLEGD
jgi:hypothetical protein